MIAAGRIFDVLIKKLSPKKDILCDEESAREKHKHYMAGLERVWSLVDELEEADIRLLHRFLENGNRPVRDVDEGCRLVRMGYVYPVRGGDAARRQYRLRDRFYRAIAYSQTQYGRISHEEPDSAR
jgi:hypothetical protein